MKMSETPSAEQIVELARSLIRIPSRAGIDSVDKIVEFTARWCERHDLPHRILQSSEGRSIGLCVRVSSGTSGPALCLDACLDTAPFGDESKWTHPPTSAAIEHGRLYGRGAADSKTAAAIFLVLARELHRKGSLGRGTLYVLLDADEHTGEFCGVKEFIRTTEPFPDAVWIGYPGNNTIVAGSRGFLRARISVFGIAAHTGSKRRKGVNAISRAARLIAALEAIPLPPEPDPEFAFGPTLTVTALHGGEGYSVVPDRCVLSLDIRLTPAATCERMRDLVEQAVEIFDEAIPGPQGSEVYWEESWPAYREPDTSPGISSLRSAAEQVFHRSIPTTVSGPSNIGNYLASLGVAAMSGFGVTYDNIHAVDEWAELATVSPVLETYTRAVLAFTGSARGMRRSAEDGVS